MRKIFCICMLLVAEAKIVHAMELTIKTKDGGKVTVDARRWHDFAALTKTTDDPVEASSATIARIDKLSLTPFDDTLIQDFDPRFAQEACALEPALCSPLFHLLAQQAARANRRLFDTLITSDSNRKLISHELARFLSACPAAILPYVNCYFYLLFAAADSTRTTEPKLWQGKNFSTLITTNDYLAHLVGNLPITKDRVLQVIVLSTETKERFSLLQNYIRYLLLLGANPNQMVGDPRACRHKCCECEYNVLIPSRTKKPLLTYCSDAELIHLLQEYLPTDNKT